MYADDGYPFVHLQLVSEAEKHQRAEERVREHTEWASLEEMMGSLPTLWAFPMAE